MQIQVEDLTVRYGRHLALDSVNLGMTTGVTGLLGPNGAGKSTLMKAVATLLPFHGRITVGSWRLPRDQHQVRQALGYLPQVFGLPATLTGREYLTYAAAMKQVKGAHMAAGEMLAQVGLEAVGDRRTGGYSGGMVQRLAIAQALLGDPEILLVDEPTAGLDPQQRAIFRQLITSRSRERTILFSTHVMADLVDVADRVLVVHEGRLLFEGGLNQLAARAQGHVWRIREESAGGSVGSDPSVTVLSERWEGPLRVTRVLSASAPTLSAEPLAPTPEDGYLSLITVAGASDVLEYVRP